jgi:hypothetical protein
MIRRWLSGVLLKWGLRLHDPKWQRTRMKDETNYQLIALPRRLTESEYEYVVDWVRSRRPGEFV